MGTLTQHAVPTQHLAGRFDNVGELRPPAAHGRYEPRVGRPGLPAPTHGAGRWSRTGPRLDANPLQFARCENPARPS